MVVWSAWVSIGIFSERHCESLADYGRGKRDQSEAAG